MDTWRDFWGVVLPVFSFGMAMGLVLFRILFDNGLIH